jgi:N-acetylglucosamine kinase-like BadF-type ATPase
MDSAMAAIRQAAQIALAGAGIEAQDVTYLVGGLTGADWPDDYELLKAGVASLGLGQTVQITNDSIVALRGGTAADYGAIVIAGTGANCAIRSPGGQEFIYHFYHDDDLQGGTALGRRALKAIYRAETGREPATLLTSSVLKLLEFACVDDLLRADVERHFTNNQTKHLAPLVFQAAWEGDQVASSIIRSFGEGLAELVTAGLQRFQMTDLELEVVLSGSVFKAPGTLIQEVMIARLHMTAPKVRLVNARYEPVVGAVLLALQASGVQVNEKVKHNIETSCQALNLIRIQ